MGGPSQSSIQQENNIASQQLQVSEEAQQQSQQETAQMQALEQPAINYNQAIASGNKSTAFTAIAPLVSQISEAGEQSRGAIMEQLPPGAGQQVALANNTQNTYNSIAQAANSAYTGSFNTLANIGSGLGSFGLSELGAGLSGLSGAATTTNNVANQQAQAKASTMGFIGSLAGAAGGAVSGTDLSKL
jgi:hypothetical protein